MRLIKVKCGANDYRHINADLIIQIYGGNNRANVVFTGGERMELSDTANELVDRILATP